jgi:WhiB family redox-sensing transcriptional regulator
MSHPDRGCRDQPRELFFPVTINARGELDEDAPEPPYPPPEAKALCDRCPVRPECLRWALDHDEVYGVWAGTTGYERSLMKRPRTRRSCLSCGSTDVVVENRHEVCLACGISWSIF